MVADDGHAAVVIDLDGKLDVRVNAQAVQAVMEFFARLALLVQHGLDIIESGIIHADLHRAFAVQAQTHGRGVHIAFFQLRLDRVGQFGIFLQPLVDGLGLLHIIADSQIAFVV